jgi:putative protease
VRAHLSGDLEVTFGNGAIRYDRIRAGDRVWRTHDPEIDRAAKPYTEAAQPVARQRVHVDVEAREGSPLGAEWWLDRQPAVRIAVESPAPLARAENRGLTLETLRAQWGRLGNTPYELGDVTLRAEGALFAPVSMLNEMRRAAVEKLQALETRTPVVELHSAADAVTKFSLPLRTLKEGNENSDVAAAELHVLVRTPEQLEAALALRPASITLDYLDFYGLRPSIERVKASGIPARVASPRVLKPGEARILNFMVSLDCPILVRSAGLVHALQGMQHATLIGDFSLNVASSITANLFLELGVERITPTHDLNAAQIANLARRAGPRRIEAIAYQHLPVFHTEHCVFCRFLSKGTTFRDCGRPCESHRVALQDAKGRAHPVLADVGCRNTVFGAEAQEASAHLAEWQGAGIRHFRLEFVHESASDVRRVYEAFADALTGRASPRELAAKLRAIAPQGTTEGSLFVPADYLKLPILQ